MPINRRSWSAAKMRKRVSYAAVFVLSSTLLSSLLLLNQRRYLYPSSLPKLVDHLNARNFSATEQLVILSCSSHSYSSVYCYYLPYVALAWRRIGFEPVVVLVGSQATFDRMPLLKLLSDDLKVTHYFIDADRSRSISTSQLVRLYAGFLSHELEADRHAFILVADVDLLPITRHRFDVHTNETNYILAVNAHCCPQESFSYENLQHIHYYPMSYVGMSRDRWRAIFLPFDRCQLTANLTIDMIECSLREKMHTDIPQNVVKGTSQWDVDQKLLSLLIAQAERSLHTHVDQRELGYRLDLNEQMLPSELDSILLYDDVHLPKGNDNVIFSNRTWSTLSKALSTLFRDDTIRLLARYHEQTAASLTMQ